MPLLLIAIAAYVGRGFGDAYFRYYRFRDHMGQEAKFAGYYTDEKIQNSLRAAADSLGMPPGAESITIVHQAKGIALWSSYHEEITLPFGKRITLEFNPSAQTTP